MSVLDADPAALDGPFVLKLFVTGTTQMSARAIVNTRRFCEEHLKGRYSLEVVDITRDPSIASKEQLLALPALLKISPSPVRRFIGDMSQVEKILNGLNISSGTSGS